jgi:putative flippase GtrA
MAFQLAAIAVGTVFNYELNKKFTWNDELLKGTLASDEKCAQTLRKGEAA